jgi:hypothetical protein
LEQVVQVGAETVVIIQSPQHLQLPILGEAVAVHITQIAFLEQVAVALLSSATLAHKEAQAEQSHQSVATPFTHSHLAVHLQLN